MKNPTDVEFIPRRSALYMPAINSRAMTKAQQLDADVIIFDLEDAVAPLQKQQAREALSQQLANSNYGPRECVIRVNGVDTPWFDDDIALLGEIFKGDAYGIRGVALPKVETAEQLQRLSRALLQVGVNGVGLWPMIETPAGVFAAQAITAESGVVCLVMGTSDLAKDLQLPLSGDDDKSGAGVRAGLQYSLSHCALAARQQGIDILDGVCLDLSGEGTLIAELAQGRGLGFTGKTLIHPKQLALCNEYFGIDDSQLEQAQAVITASQAAEEQGSGVVVVDGRLVEALHVEAALRICGLARAMAARGF